MASENIKRKIAVIFATDVVGYSTSMEVNEVQTLKNLRACKKILEDLYLGKGPSKFIVLIGYSGWSSQQLNKELKLGTLNKHRISLLIKNNNGIRNGANMKL